MLKMNSNFGFSLFLWLLYSVSNSRGAPSQCASETCQLEQLECDGNFEHLPMRRRLQGHLASSWVVQKEGENPARKSFKEYISLTRITPCVLELAFSNEVFYVGANGSSITEICRRSSDSRIPENFVKSLNLAWGLSLPSVEEENEISEVDLLNGLCPTTFVFNETTGTTQNTKDLTKCNCGEDFICNSNMKSRKITSLSKMSCNQQRSKASTRKPSRIVHHMTCTEDHIVESTIYKSNVVLVLFATPDIGRLFNVRDLSPIRVKHFMNEERKSTSNDVKISLNRELRNICKIDSPLKTLNMGINLNQDLGLTYHKLLKLCEVATQDEIISVYNTIISNGICQTFEENERIRYIFSSTIRDAYSAASASALCQLTIEAEKSKSTNYFKSVIPWTTLLMHKKPLTYDQLSPCLMLLNIPNWKEYYLEVAVLIGKSHDMTCNEPKNCDAGDINHKVDYFTHSHYHGYKDSYNEISPRMYSNSPDSTNIFSEGVNNELLANSCSLNFTSVIPRRILSMLDNCENADETTQKEQMHILEGLASIGIISSEFKDVIIRCSAKIVPDIIRTSSMKVMARNQCGYEVKEILRSAVQSNDESDEVRIAAFRSLTLCDHGAADQLANCDCIDNKNVLSYIQSTYHGKHSNSNHHQKFDFFYHLSSSYQIDLTSLSNLPILEKIIPYSKLDIDLIYKESFIPHFLKLKFNNGDLWKSLENAFQMEFRLENIESVVIHLLKSRMQNLNQYDWKEKLLTILYEVVAESLPNFLPTNNTINEASGKENSFRNKRSIDFDDLLNLINDFIPESIDVGTIVLNMVRDDYVIKHWNSEINPTKIKEDLENLVRRLSTFVSEILLGQKSLTTFSAITIVHEEMSWFSMLGHKFSVTSYRGITLDGRGHASLDLVSAVLGGATKIDSLLQGTFNLYKGTHFELESTNDVSKGYIAMEESVTKVSLDVNAFYKIENPTEFSITLDIPYTDSANSISSIHVHQIMSYGEALIFDYSFDSDFNEKVCSEEVEQLTGFSACFRKMVFIPTNFTTGSFNSSFLISTEISPHVVDVSLKNSGSQSVFIDTKLSVESDQERPYLHAVLGAFTMTENIQLRLDITGRQLKIVHEGTIVNAENLKRIEIRSEHNAEKKGIKAEMIIVHNGGQVTYKPRVVVSTPNVAEDNLLEGYSSTFWSPKEKSVTLELYTLGSLQETLNVSLAGYVSLLTPTRGPITFNISEVRVTTSAYRVGLDGSVAVTADHVLLNTQMRWLDDLILFAAKYTKTDEDDHETLLHYNVDHDDYQHRPVQQQDLTQQPNVIRRRKEVHQKDQRPKRVTFTVQVFAPTLPSLDTKLNVHCQVYSNEISNNVTLWRGADIGDPTEFSALHVVTWHASTVEDSIADSNDKIHFGKRFMSIFFPYDMMLILNNSMILESQPMNQKATLDHTISLSSRFFESLAIANVDHSTHKLVTNFYDRSEAGFKYDIEIELSNPEWKFSYVDSIVQLTTPSHYHESTLDSMIDVLGQSTVIMPSTKVYTSSSRFRLVFREQIILFEMLYDTIMTDGGDSWRSVFFNTVHWSTAEMHAEVDFAIDGKTLFNTEIYVQDSVDTKIGLKFIMTEVASLSTHLTVSTTSYDSIFTIELASSNREIRGISRGSLISLGDMSLEGELLWDAVRDPTKQISLKSAVVTGNMGALDINWLAGAIGSEWLGDIKIKLGHLSSDKQTILLTLQMPDLTKLEIESSLQLDLSTSEAILVSLNRVNFPSGSEHKLLIEGSGLASDFGEAELSLGMTLESPVTSDISISLSFSALLNNERKFDTLIEVSATSQGLLWEPLHLKTETRRGVATFPLKPSVQLSPTSDGLFVHLGGSLGQKVFSFNIEGLYRPALSQTTADVTDLAMSMTDDSSTLLHCRLQAEGPENILRGLKKLQLKLDGSHALVRAKEDRGTQLNILSSVHIDDSLVYSSEGSVMFRLLELTTGSLNVTQMEPLVLKQKYLLEARMDNGVFKATVAGLLNDTAEVRASVQYEDYQELEISASYSGGLDILKENANFAMETRLEGIGFGLKENGTDTRSLQTSGTLTIGRVKTRVMHSLSISPEQSSTSLRINSLFGKRVRLGLTHDNDGLNQWHSTALMQLGTDIYHFEDIVALHSYKNFSLYTVVHAPSLDYHNTSGLVSCTPLEAGVYLFGVMKEIKNGNEILKQRGRLDYTLDQIGAQASLQISASQLILDALPRNDYNLSYSLINDDDFKMVSSNISIGETQILGLGAGVSSSSRYLLLGICSSNHQCFRLLTHGANRMDISSRSFELKAEALNTLLWVDDQNHNNERMIQHSVEFAALDKHNDIITVSGGIQRKLCQEALCTDHTLISNIKLVLDILPDNGGNLSLSFGDRVIKVTSQYTSYYENQPQPTSELDRLCQNYTASTGSSPAQLERAAADLVFSQLVTELLPSTSRNAEIKVAKLFKLSLFLNEAEKPEEEIVWRTLAAKYDIGTGAEYCLATTVAHPSMKKDVSVKGNLVVGGEQITSDVYLNVLGDVSNVQHHRFKLQKNRGRMIFTFKATKPISKPAIQLAGLTITFLPAPDVSKLEMVMYVPTQSHVRNRRGTVESQSSELTTGSFLSRNQRQILPFANIQAWHQMRPLKVECNLKFVRETTAAECQIGTPSLSESMSASWHSEQLHQAYDTNGCHQSKLNLTALSFSSSVSSLSCPQWPSFGIKATYDDPESGASDLFLHAGIDSPERISVDLLDFAWFDATLYPPFLLHMTANGERNWRQKLERYQALASKFLNQFSSKAMKSFRNVWSDFWPVIDAVSIYPVNDTRQNGEISSVLTLIDYLDPHFIDILHYLSKDELMSDLRKSFRHSLHLFEWLLQEMVSPNFSQRLAVSSEEMVHPSSKRVWDLLHRLYQSSANEMMKLKEAVHEWSLFCMKLSKDHFSVVYQEALTTYQDISNTVLGSTPVKALDLMVKSGREQLSKHPVIKKISEVTTTSLYATLQVLESFLFNDHSSTVAVDFLIPLPVVVHSLRSLLYPVNPFHILPSDINPTNYQESTYESLDDSSFSYSTWRYISHYVDLLSNPSQLYEKVVPPYPSYGVLFYPELYVDFNEKVHLLNPECSEEVLLLGHGVYDQKLIVHYGKHEAASTTPKNSFKAPLHIGELNVLVPPYYIKLNSEKLEVNNVSVSLPFTVAGNLSVVRDLASVTAVLPDNSHLSKGTKITCSSSTDTCVVFVEDWIATTASYGALTGSVKSSISQTCGTVSTDTPMSDSDLYPLNAAELVCRALIISSHSQIAECRHVVRSDTFYQACILQLREHHRRYPRETGQTFRNARTSMPTDANDLYGVLDYLFWLEKTTFGGDNLTESSSRSHLFTSTEVSDEDLGLICRVVWAYSRVCAYRNKQQLVPETTLCEQYRLNQRDYDVWDRNDIRSKANKGSRLGSRTEELAHTDDVGPHAGGQTVNMKGDILLLIENENCLNYTYQSVLKHLPGHFRTAGRRKDIDVQLGIIRYSSDAHPHSLVYYSHEAGNLLDSPSNTMDSLAINLLKGSTSLPDMDDTQEASDTPEVLANDLPESFYDDLSFFGLSAVGNLHEAVLTSLRYPYRKGSARVVLIAACTMQDIRMFSPVLVEEFRRRDIAVFFISPRSLFSTAPEANSPRRAIGVDRFWLYKLDGAKMHLSDTWGIEPPQMNVGRLAIYSGGGVFSNAALPRYTPRGRGSRQMRLFRTVLTVSIVNRLADMASTGN